MAVVMEIFYYVDSWIFFYHLGWNLVCQAVLDLSSLD